MTPRPARGGKVARKAAAAARKPHTRSAARNESIPFIDNPAQASRTLSQQLSLRGLRLENISGDGNCMFRALSSQSHGTPERHYAVRTEICDFVAANREHYVHFVDLDTEKSFEDHVSNMRQLGTYGGHLELVAFARLRKRSIKVFQPGLIYIIAGEDESPAARKKREERAQNGTHDGEEDEEGPLYIAYHLWEHYSSIRNIDGPSTGLPRIRERPTPADDSSTSSAPSTSALTPNDTTSTDDDDDSPASAEENLLRSSLPAGSSYSLSALRDLIKQHGSWESALEAVLDEGDPDSPAPDNANTPATESTEPSDPTAVASALPVHLREYRDASPATTSTSGSSSGGASSPSTSALKASTSPSSVSRSSSAGKSSTLNGGTDVDTETGSVSTGRRSRSSSDLASEDEGDDEDVPWRGRRVRRKVEGGDGVDSDEEVSKELEVGRDEMVLDEEVDASGGAAEAGSTKKTRQRPRKDGTIRAKKANARPSAPKRTDTSSTSKPTRYSTRSQPTTSSPTSSPPVPIPPSSGPSSQTTSPSPPSLALSTSTSTLKAARSPPKVKVRKPGAQKQSEIRAKTAAGNGMTARERREARQKRKHEERVAKMEGRPEGARTRSRAKSGQGGSGEGLDGFKELYI